MESTELQWCPVKAPHQASNYDELLMQHSLNFAGSLKDLKDLQKQLYSAAEYFESSYSKDDHQQLVIETFKEYATKALVSTVDHLGSVASKLNNFLEEKVDEVSATKLRFSCIERRLHTCREFIDISGHSQQSLVLGTPKHHKRYMTSGNYVLPWSFSYFLSSASQLHKLFSSTKAVRQCKLISLLLTYYSAGKFISADDISESVHKNSILSPRGNLPRTKQVFQATRSQSLPLPSRANSRASSTESSPSPSMFSFTTTSDKDQGRRSVSPFRFSLKRSGSVVSRSASPSSSHINPRAPSEPRRAMITRVNPPRRESEKDIEVYSKKSKQLLKALLSIHRSRKEGIPSRFRDGR